MTAMPAPRALAAATSIFSILLFAEKRVWITRA